MEHPDCSIVSSRFFHSLFYHPFLAIIFGLYPTDSLRLFSFVIALQSPGILRNSSEAKASLAAS